MNIAILAEIIPDPVCRTFPIWTSPISAGFTPVRSNVALMRGARISSGDDFDSPPRFAFVRADLTAAQITTSSGDVRPGLRPFEPIPALICDEITLIRSILPNLKTVMLHGLKFRGKFMTSKNPRDQLFDPELGPTDEKQVCREIRIARTIIPRDLQMQQIVSVKLPARWSKRDE
jgi:hypothetical protein